MKIQLIDEHNGVFFFKFHGTFFNFTKSQRRPPPPFSASCISVQGAFIGSILEIAGIIYMKLVAAFIDFLTSGKSVHCTKNEVFH